MRMRAPHPWPLAVLASADCCLRAIARSTDPALANDAQAKGLKTHVARRRGIRQQHHVAYTEVPQNLRADADLDAAAFRIRMLALLAFGVLCDRTRHTLRSQIPNEDDDTSALACDLGHGLLDQSPTRALAAADAQQIGQHIYRMYAHQHGTGGAKIAFDKSQVLDGLYGRFVDVEIEGATEQAIDGGFSDLAHDAIMAQPIADQIFDGADLQAVALGEGDQIGHACHGAVVVHNLADDAGRKQASQAGEIDGGLRVAGAHEHATFARNQRENVPRGNDVLVVLGRVDGGGNGAGTIVRRNAGGDALARLD